MVWGVEIIQNNAARLHKLEQKFRNAIDSKNTDKINAVEKELEALYNEIMNNIPTQVIEPQN